MGKKLIQALRGKHHGMSLVKRRDSEYSLFIAYEYDRPFDWQNVSLVSFGGWSRGDSNKDFYDAQGLFLASDLNDRF